MKFEILLFIFLFSTLLSGQETVLFIDANSNEHEIETAKKAALSQGKKFISYPKEGESLNREKAIELLRNVPFSTLILSGHNGGGSFSGDTGDGIGYEDVQEAISENKFSRTQTNTLMLLGCNTANPGQVMTWKGIFPELDIIAGYDGTAPSQNTRAGLSYITEILTKKDELLDQGDSKKLERFVRSIQDIHYLEAGLYVSQPECNGGEAIAKEYLFRPLSYEVEDRFKEFDFKECGKKLEVLKNEKMPLFLEYYLGKKDNDSAQSREELRRLYNFFHQYSYCFEASDVNLDYKIGNTEYNLNIPSWQTILSLRFWKETQDNIGRYYEKKITENLDFLKRLKTEPEYFEQLKGDKLKELKALRDKLVFYNNNWNERIEETQRILDRLKAKELKFKNLEKEISAREDGYKEILTPSEISTLPLLTRSVNFTGNREEDNKLIGKVMKNAGVASEKIDKYLSWSKEIGEMRDERERLSEEIFFVEEVEEYLSQVTDEEKAKELAEDYASQIKDLKMTIDENQKVTHDDIASQIPVGLDYSVENFKNSSRKEISEFSHQLTGLRWRTDSFFPDKEKSKIEAFSEFTNNVSFSLHEAYIPFSWHERQEIVGYPTRRDTHWSQDFFKARNSDSSGIMDEFYRLRDGQDR